MVTFTMTSLVFCTFFTLCTSITIGLPEDHVDVGSCFDRACISELDWHEIGEKWHNFRLTVKAMNDSRSDDMRKAIWRVFQNDNTWNGDEKQIARNMKDIRNMRSIMDKRTEEIRAVQLKDATTRYDHQAIIAMEGDTTVAKAAHFLYNKHPSVSTLYEYSPKTDTLKVIAGKEHFLGEHSRVQVNV
ncbi:uncharacterized protein LOC128549587 [Mercenaria mercenaria]|uniref:uncharacterized protein LOC128549587 n=1 Tax=Mercenaria mercenaria TaxID=6596 RepID=UPI00234F8423|nr:uncharacterized protein LOC128549587 [Mercenaria mercenaria]